MYIYVGKLGEYSVIRNSYFPNTNSVESPAHLLRTPLIVNRITETYN